MDTQRIEQTIGSLGTVESMNQDWARVDGITSERNARKARKQLLAAGYVLCLESAAFTRGLTYAAQVLAAGCDPYEDWDYREPARLTAEQSDEWRSAYWQGVSDAVLAFDEDED